MKSKRTLWDALERTVMLHWEGGSNEATATLNAAEVVRFLGARANIATYSPDTVRGILSQVVSCWRERGLSNATMNRKIAAFSKVLKTAREAGWCALEVPEGFRFKEGSGRTRVVSPGELNSLCTFMSAECGLIAHVLFHTGLRLGEVFRLQREDARCAYDLQPSLCVRTSKNGTARTVPLTASVAPVVAAAVGRAQTRTYLFATTPQEFRRQWNDARAKMGLSDDPEFVPHALRHTCATNLAKAGVSLPAIQRWMGHKSIRVTMRYAHLNDSQLFEAAKALDARAS